MGDAPILYGPDGRPIKRETLTRAVAGPSVMGVRTPIAGYPADGLNPRKLAALLRAADYGDPLRYFEMAEQIEERNTHYAGVLGTRKRQVSQLDITVEAASDDKEHVRHADELREWLARDELESELFDLLDAIGKGMSIVELVWDTSEGDWRPKLEWRDPRWFRFDPVDGATPVLRDAAGDRPLESFKFVTLFIRAKSGLPVRSGLARLAAWNWMFKGFTERDWAIFAQTYGQPMRIGKYPAGATEADKDTLFEAVVNIAGDCSAIMPQSMEIEFVQAENLGAGSDLYLKRAEWLDQQMSKAVLGQTGTTDATPGRLGNSDDHTQVREDIERADAKALAAALNRDLVRPFVELNHGPQPKYPRLKIGRPEEKKVEQTIAGIKDLVPLGLRVEKSWANDLLGIPDPDEGAELLAPAAQPAFPPPGLDATALQAVQSARRANDDIDRLADATERLVAPAADALIDQVRAVVEHCESFEQLQAELKQLKPALAEKNFAGLLRMALVMAELSGRAEIADAARRA